MNDETPFKVTGRPLAVDSDATSAEPGLPAFIARPQDAPVYYGFVVLSDVVVEGFTFGKITDFEAEPTDYGDAFVIAPDNSRCGLVWEVDSQRYFKEVIGLEEGRWGVWAVAFPHPMNNRENARRNLEHILPELKVQWERWRNSKQP